MDGATSLNAIFPKAQHPFENESTDCSFYCFVMAFAYLHIGLSIQSLYAISLLLYRWGPWALLRSLARVVASFLVSDTLFRDSMACAECPSSRMSPSHWSGPEASSCEWHSWTAMGAWSYVSSSSQCHWRSDASWGPWSLEVTLGAPLPVSSRGPSQRVRWWGLSYQGQNHRGRNILHWWFAGRSAIPS